MSLKIWKKLSTKLIARNDYWSYFLDKFEIENQHNGEYHYVHTLGSTMVIPITSDNKIILTNQFRYLHQRESLEFPCGSVESNLSFEENARKELREETGFDATELIYIGEFAPYSGVSDEMCYVYLGTGLFESPLPHDETEEINISFHSFEEIEELLVNNEIWDGMTFAAWQLAVNKLKEMIK
jgi:ADP-ribose pyrophosphatase